MNRLHVIAAAASALLSAAPAVAKTPVLPPAMAGFMYDFVGSAVTVDATGHSHVQPLIRGHATTIGAKTRIDINDAGSVSESMRGSYLLLFDGGRRLLWVSPTSHQYRETDPESLLGGLGPLGDGSNGLVSMTASNVHIGAEKVGQGPVIEGHTTVHYRLHESMDMKTKLFNKTVTTHDESITDYYYATDVPNVVNPFLSSAPTVPEDGALVFGDDYYKQLRDATSKLYQGGAPLRTVVSNRSTDDFGHVQSTVTTTEMMNLKQANVNTTLFDVPLGYTATASHVSELDGQGGTSPFRLTPPSPTPGDRPVPALTPESPSRPANPMTRPALQRLSPSVPYSD